MRVIPSVHSLNRIETCKPPQFNYIGDENTTVLREISGKCKIKIIVKKLMAPKIERGHRNLIQAGKRVLPRMAANRSLIKINSKRNLWLTCKINKRRELIHRLM